MGFKEGFLHSIGFSAGMALTDKTEQRPILRKRFFINCVYIISLLYCFYQAFSWQSQILLDHIFISFIGKYGVTVINANWMFTILTSIITLFVVSIVIIVCAQPDRKLVNLPRSGDFILSLVFSLLSFVTIYDLAYYTGNSCMPYFDHPCINFANTAWIFALCSTGIYFLRSQFVLRPSEKGSKTFNGEEITELIGGRMYFIPTLPIPHTLYVILIYMFDFIPFLWDFYHHPDGRESAQQLHLRRR